MNVIGPPHCQQDFTVMALQLGGYWPHSLKSRFRPQWFSCLRTAKEVINRHAKLCNTETFASTVGCYEGSSYCPVEHASKEVSDRYGLGLPGVLLKRI
jgi:hypothetical protein